MTRVHLKQIAGGGASSRSLLEWASGGWRGSSAHPACGAYVVWGSGLDGANASLSGTVTDEVLHFTSATVTGTLTANTGTTNLLSIRAQTSITVNNGAAITTGGGQAGAAGGAGGATTPSQGGAGTANTALASTALSTWTTTSGGSQGSAGTTSTPGGAGGAGSASVGSGQGGASGGSGGGGANNSSSGSAGRAGNDSAAVSLYSQRRVPLFLILPDALNYNSSGGDVSSLTVGQGGSGGPGGGGGRGGTAGTAGTAGGQGSGFLFVAAPTITTVGTGALQAVGVSSSNATDATGTATANVGCGGGGAGGGGGGGGLVRTYCETFSGTISVSGGTGGTGGAGGVNSGNANHSGGAGGAGAAGGAGTNSQIVY